MKQSANIQNLFAQQGKQLPALRKETARERLSKLGRIRRYLLNKDHEKALFEAMQSDLRKSPSEVIATEVGPILMALNHIKQHLRRWMRERRVPTPLSMMGMSSHLRYDPKGRVLIISPWNYPLQLALNPLIHAIAAGNAVVLKPSELSPKVSAFLAKMVAELFQPEEVAVVLGEVEAATELLALPFNHIYFTGSPQVGKIVMGAAAKHLASVTLELGGKSPAVVDGTVNAAKVGNKLAWAKCMNSGQTCIAPDYGIVQKEQLKGLLAGFERGLEQMYGKDIQASHDFGRLVNAKHFERVKLLVEEAVQKGATLAIGGKMDASDLFISPTVLTDVTEDMAIMHEEIFGPVLPISNFSNKEEVPGIVAHRPEPLAFYIMSNSRKFVRHVVRNTVSGGVVVNELMVGSLNPHLPFGGINNSGIGKSNGREAFLAFSNARGMVERNWGTLSFVRPPFSPKMDRLLKFIFKKF